VRDAQGRKMSKSLGNGIDPLEIIDKYGADALRFALATGNAPGNDMRFSDEKIESSRNFCNKLWNAARFILMNLKTEITPDSLPKTLAPEDKWILTRYTRTAQEVNEMLDRFEIGMALGKLYDFIWDDFCDWYIELAKTSLSEGGEERMRAERVLCFVLRRTLTLLHPFMPFITEEIWQALPHEGSALMVSPWPEYDASYEFKNEEDSMECVMNLIRAVRNRRAEMNVPPSKKTRLIIATDRTSAFKAGEAFISRLAYASSLDLTPVPPADTSGMVSAVTGGAQAYMPLAELVDVEKEQLRLNKEYENAKAELVKLDLKLNNEGFVSKAPAQIVQTERDRADKLRALISRIRENLDMLGAK
jgi:valyl-tRNA synthetase